MEMRLAWALLGLPALAVAYVGFQLYSDPPPSSEPASHPSLLWRVSSEPSASSVPLRPLPASLELDEGKVRLGQRLFNDPRLSRGNTIACASCHNLAAGGTDGMPTSVGINGSRTNLNAPTVLNSGFNASQFWDGRAASLEEQIDGPLNHPDEMGTTWEEVIPKIEDDSDYRRAFAELYPNGIRPDAVRDAIAAYERSLVTANSPFDRYLRGETEAISKRAQAGYQLFTAYGCSSCHQGINVGGNLFQKFGTVMPRFKDIGSFKKADLGRYNVTGREEDRFVFKVPSLRNVTLTAPYFRDGSVESLDQAIRLMGLHQLGRELSDEELSLIAEFLGTLTGKLRSP